MRKEIKIKRVIINKLDASPRQRRQKFGSVVKVHQI